MLPTMKPDFDDLEIPAPALILLLSKKYSILIFGGVPVEKLLNSMVVGLVSNLADAFLEVRSR